MSIGPTLVINDGGGILVTSSFRRSRSSSNRLVVIREHYRIVADVLGELSALKRPLQVASVWRIIMVVTEILLSMMI